MEKRGGIGILGILQITFLTLKLTDNIDWSWFWVFSPIILPFLFVIFGGLIYGIILLILLGLGIIKQEDINKK